MPQDLKEVVSVGEKQKCDTFETKVLSLLL